MPGPPFPASKDRYQRIDLEIWHFAGAALIAFALAWVTVAGHAIRVAGASPVGALRYE